MRMIKNKRKNQQGFILALTIMCALVLTTVMISTMFVSTKGTKVAKNLKESVQTLNAADAAIKQAKTALSTWLINQQVGTGTMVDFTTILTGSASAGKLVIPSNSTDWGALSLLDNTVSITVSDSEGAADSDRVMKLTATATSSSRQRVQIEAYVQAPSEANTTGMPDVLTTATFCSDALVRSQTLRLKEDSFLDAHNYTVPSFSCVGTDCDTTTSLVGSGNLPPAIMFNSLKQKITVTDTSSYDGSPSTVQITTDSTNCDQWFDYADQVSLLSDSLPYVNVITSETVSSASLGTRDDPVVSIFNGASIVTRRGVTRKKTVIDANSRGSGIMMIQYDGDTNSDAAALVGRNNYYFEGLAIVYGDEMAGFKLRGSTMYGAVVLLTGSEDESLKERFALRNDSVFKFSTGALDQADTAMGHAESSTVPITSASDARNQVITIGWKEVYGGA